MLRDPVPGPGSDPRAAKRNRTQTKPKQNPNKTRTKPRQNPNRTQTEHRQAGDDPHCLPCERVDAIAGGLCRGQAEKSQSKTVEWRRGTSTATKRHRVCQHKGRENRKRKRTRDGGRKGRGEWGEGTSHPAIYPPFTHVRRRLTSPASRATHQSASEPAVNGQPRPPPKRG